LFTESSYQYFEECMYRQFHVSCSPFFQDAAQFKVQCTKVVKHGGRATVSHVGVWTARRNARQKCV